MSWINKGDMLQVEGQIAIATSSDYVKLVYDAYDREMMSLSRDYEGGTATIYVGVLFPETGRQMQLPASRVKKLSSVAE